MPSVFGGRAWQRGAGEIVDIHYELLATKFIDGKDLTGY